MHVPIRKTAFSNSQQKHFRLDDNNVFGDGHKISYIEHQLYQLTCFQRDFCVFVFKNIWFSARAGSLISKL